MRVRQKSIADMTSGLNISHILNLEMISLKLLVLLKKFTNYLNDSKIRKKEASFCFLVVSLP